jgi:hypothetical protein
MPCRITNGVNEPAKHHQAGAPDVLADERAPSLSPLRQIERGAPAPLGLEADDLREGPLDLPRGHVRLDVHTAPSAPNSISRV